MILRLVSILSASSLPLTTCLAGWASINILDRISQTTRSPRCGRSYHRHGDEHLYRHHSGQDTPLWWQAPHHPVIFHTGCVHITLAETACLPGHVYHECGQGAHVGYGGACRQSTGSGALCQTLEPCWHSICLRNPASVSEAGAAREELGSPLRLVRTLEQYSIRCEGKFLILPTLFLVSAAVI